MSQSWLMSVYQRERDIALWQYTALIGAATTDNDLELLQLSIRLDKPVMIGVNGVHAIVKPNRPGDEGFDFITLQDVCLTVADLKKMKEAKVDDPANLPSLIFTTDILVDLSELSPIRVPVNFVAKDRGHAPATLRDILRNQHSIKGFDEAFILALIRAVTRQHANEEVDFAITHEITAIGEADDDTPEWEFPEERP